MLTRPSEALQRASSRWAIRSRHTATAENAFADRWQPPAGISIGFTEVEHWQPDSGDYASTCLAGNTRVHLLTVEVSIDGETRSAQVVVSDR